MWFTDFGKLFKKRPGKGCVHKDKIITFTPEVWFKVIFMSYTQTKKKRPIFMVLYLSIQLRCRNKNKTKMFIKCPTHKKKVIIWFYLLTLKGYET